MKHIKQALSLFALMLVSVLISACASSAGFKDGIYSAQAAEFAPSGWKEVLEITIESGELVKIDWDAVYKDASIPIRKKQYSKSGLYGMMAAGAIAEWYDQAVTTEQFVLKNGIDALEVNSEGYTDAVTGCTIHVTEFDVLLRDCLEQAKK